MTGENEYRAKAGFNAFRGNKIFQEKANWGMWWAIHLCGSVQILSLIPQFPKIRIFLSLVRLQILILRFLQSLKNRVLCAIMRFLTWQVTCSLQVNIWVYGWMNSSSSDRRHLVLILVLLTSVFLVLFHSALLFSVLLMSIFLLQDGEMKSPCRRRYFSKYCWLLRPRLRIFLEKWQRTGIHFFYSNSAPFITTFESY